MATASGIWNHTAPVNGLANAKPAAAGASATNESGASTISANDFLSLLVTEMKNQDPTANNDPNAYVNQLVQVNSLEQLININQTLTAGFSTSGNSPTGGSQPIAVSGTAASDSAATGVAQPVAPRENRFIGANAPMELQSEPASRTHAIPIANGNLSVPASNPAAHRVSHSLSHRARGN